MSIRVSGRAVRGIFALIAVTAGTSLLAGCSGLGGFGNDNTTTGSVSGGRAGNLAQPMPPALGQSMPQQVAQISAPASGQVVSSGPGRYLPPANIGPRAISPMTTASIQTAPVQGAWQDSSNSVNRQELPALTTTAARSAPTMPALQPTPKPVQVASTQTVAPPVPAAPKLSVVPQNGFKHTIQSGESLYAIARRYDVSTDSIMHANQMASADKIFVGQKIVIPGAVEELAKRAPTGVKREDMVDDVATGGTTPLVDNETPSVPKVAETPVKVAKAAPVAESGNAKFRWPVSGSVIADFASSKTGINISTQEGTAVRAAEAGTVIYVGNAVEGYGNLILVKHENGYVSAYAHLKDITVAKGDSVGRGDAIGTAGMTGSVNRPQVHFELRKGATPVDPMPMLAS